MRKRLSIATTLAAAVIFPTGASAAGSSAPSGGTAAAGSSAPSGGTAAGQVIGLSVAMLLLSAALLYFGLGHRSGRVQALGRLAAFSERVSGLPGWAALPAGLASGGLLSAVFGLYWDISLHIDNGRDPGPLANPAHYFILAGLFALISAGWFAIVLPSERPGRAALRITGDWYAPVSGGVLAVCASFAMLGFPLDDLWHRMFGQDVTLWGPTHLMMLTGAITTLLGIAGLLAEGRASDTSSHGPQRLAGPIDRRAFARRFDRVTRIALCGGILAGLSVYQGEFDYGVPQFRLLLHPLLIAFAASAALVAARVLAGRGAALGAAIFFIALRGIISLLVDPVLGQSLAHFPLYLAEALLVESAAFVVAPRSGYRFAVLCGGLIGTVGTIAEYGWSHVWMPFPWPARMLPAGIAIALPVALAGGALGTFLARALRFEQRRAGRRGPLVAALLSTATLIVCVGILIPQRAPTIASASVLAQSVAGSHGRWVNLTAQLTPASLTDHADALHEIAWQGHRRMVSAALMRVGPGTVRSSRPLPTFGSWKSMLAFERGSTMALIGVYAPADRAIPVAGISTPAVFTRPLVPFPTILQRERKRGVASWIWSTADFAVLALVLGLLAVIGWALVRLAGGAPAATDPRVHPASTRRGRRLITRSGAMSSTSDPEVRPDALHI